MLCSGDTWYGKYGFKPVDLERETLNLSRYEQYLYNKHILSKTKVKCCDIKQYIIGALQSQRTKDEIKKLKTRLDNYDNKYIIELMSDFFDDYEDKCFIFNDVYWKIRQELKLYDLFEYKYFLVL